MAIEQLTPDEQCVLLKLARGALENAAKGKPLDSIDMQSLSSALRQEGASFVTLTIGGSLRGCIGALQAYQPLAEDVREHAVAAALEDPRFPPVRPAELPDIEIEISRLTPPAPLEYSAPEDLLARLRPHIDGVIVRDGFHRATFLPQVWEKLPDPVDFMDNLCDKAGMDARTWSRKPLDIQIYQVEEFHE